MKSPAITANHTSRYFSRQVRQVSHQRQLRHHSQQQQQQQLRGHLKRSSLKNPFWACIAKSTRGKLHRRWTRRQQQLQHHQLTPHQQPTSSVTSQSAATWTPTTISASAVAKLLPITRSPPRSKNSRLLHSHLPHRQVEVLRLWSPWRRARGSGYLIILHCVCAPKANHWNGLFCNL